MHTQIFLLIYSINVITIHTQIIKVYKCISESLTNIPCFKYPLQKSTNMFSRVCYFNPYMYVLTFMFNLHLPTACHLWTPQLLSVKLLTVCRRELIHKYIQPITWTYCHSLRQCCQLGGFGARSRDFPDPVQSEAWKILWLFLVSAAARLKISSNVQTLKMTKNGGHHPPAPKKKHVCVKSNPLICRLLRTQFATCFPLLFFLFF